MQIIGHQIARLIKRRSWVEKNDPDRSITQNSKDFDSKIELSLLIVIGNKNQIWNTFEARTSLRTVDAQGAWGWNDDTHSFLSTFSYQSCVITHYVTMSIAIMNIPYTFDDQIFISKKSTRFIVCHDCHLHPRWSWRYCIGIDDKSRSLERLQSCCSHKCLCFQWQVGIVDSISFVGICSVLGRGLAP